MAKVHNENRATKMSFFRRFWVKEPHRSENISDEKRYLYLVGLVLRRKRTLGCNEESLALYGVPSIVGITHSQVLWSVLL